MTGHVSAGEIEAVGDITTGAAIDRPLSQSGAAVDRRISAQVKPLVSAAIADDPTLTAAGEAAVNNAIAGKNLLEASKGILPTGTDLNDVYLPEHIGSWLLGASATFVNAPTGLRGAAILEVSRGERTSSFSVTQKVFNKGQYWWRESGQASSGQWSKWQQAATTDNTPAEMILALAKADGWRAVYDPGNPATVTENADGVLIGIADGLANWPDLTGNNINNRIVRGEIGQLTGFKGASLAAKLDGTLSQSVTYLVAVKIEGTDSGVPQYLIGSDETPRHLVFLDESNQLTLAVVNLARETVAPAGVAVIEVTVNGTASSGRLNGQYSFASPPGIATSGMSHLRVGARSAPQPNFWQGVIGPVLVYRGAIPLDAKQRMSKLLMDLAGVKPEQPPFTPGVRAFSVDSNGVPTLIHGDPDFVSPNGIQSTTKMLNALVARKFLTTSAMLDETVTLKPEDMYGANEPLFQVGDVVSYRDLMYAAALPSSNTAPDAIARSIGERFIPADGNKNGLQLFADEMNRTIAGWGFTNASVSSPAGTAHLSPRQLANVLQRLGKDPELKNIYAESRHTVTVTGENARTFEILSTMWDSRWYPLRRIRGKTGSGSTRTHLAMTWEGADGSEHSTVILDVPAEDNRWREMRVAQESVLSGVPHVDKTLSPLTGGGATSTAVRDITALFEASVTSSGGGVFLTRTGSKVMLTFAAVQVSKATFANVLAAGFRPGQPFMYGSVSVDGVAHEVTVTRNGTVSGLPVGVSMRGSLEWEVPAYATFPVPPFPGVFHSL